MSETIFFDYYTKLLLVIKMRFINLQSLLYPSM